MNKGSRDNRVHVTSRYVTCTLLSLLPLFIYFFVLPSLLHPSILFNCFLCLLLFFFFCCPLGSTLAYILLCFFSAIIFRMMYQSNAYVCMCVYCHALYNRCSSMHHQETRIIQLVIIIGGGKYDTYGEVYTVYERLMVISASSTLC